MIRPLHIAAILLTCSIGSRAAPLDDPEKIRRFIETRPEQDIVTWADETRGEPFTVRFISADGKDLTVEKTLANGLARRTVPFREIAGITFRFTPVEAAAHEDPRADHVPLLDALWENRKPTLRVDNAETLLTGLSLATALRSDPTTERLERASAVLSEVLAKDIPPRLRERANGESLIIEFLTAVTAEDIPLAEEIAWKITSETEYPDAMLLATGFLGERHFEQLKALEEEHPRWHLDDEIRPLRERLYHLSLDFPLYPSLFHPNRKRAASEGLKAAAEVYRHTGARELRLATLEDLAALYPDSEAAKETAGDLENLRTNQPEPAPPEPDAEQENENEPEKAQPTTIPPKPKTYNLFTD